jgi:hypothetical protein
MRALLKSDQFWTAFIAIVVPFGWLYPLLRQAYRTISR